MPAGSEQLPDLELVDNDGDPVQLADLEGTPLVLNYWYSSCAPCKEELPAFATVAAEFSAAGPPAVFAGARGPHATSERSATRPLAHGA